MLSFCFLFYNDFEQIRGGKEGGGLRQAVLLNTWLNVFPFFYRATPVVLPGTGGSWQCCLWRTELSWRYWLWLPLKIALSPSDACWYLWLAKDPDNMDFSCEWALKASHDRLYGGGTKGEGLFLVFQRFFQKMNSPFWLCLASVSCIGLLSWVFTKPCTLSCCPGEIWASTKLCYS